MALFSLIKYYGPLLFVIILQATKISALQCYECKVTPALSPEDAAAKEDCIKDIPPDEFLVNETSLISLVEESAGTFRQEFITSEFKMTKGPFCMKISLTENKEKEVFVIRRMVADGPDARDLDDDGCIVGQTFRTCFCKEDKCNSDLWKPSPNSGILSTSPSFFLWIVAFAMLARKSL